MNAVRRLSAQRRIFELNKAADQELKEELVEQFESSILKGKNEEVSRGKSSVSSLKPRSIL